jgi:hypothetical protein
MSSPVLIIGQGVKLSDGNRTIGSPQGQNANHRCLALAKLGILHGSHERGSVRLIEFPPSPVELRRVLAIAMANPSIPTGYPDPSVGTDSYAPTRGPLGFKVASTPPDGGRSS